MDNILPSVVNYCVYMLHNVNLISIFNINLLHFGVHQIPPNDLTMFILGL